MKLEGLHTVYNLEIHQSHNYFVSISDILVHNVDPNGCPENSGKKSNKKDSTDEENVDDLREKYWKEEDEFIEAGKKAPPGTSKRYGKQKDRDSWDYNRWPKEFKRWWHRTQKEKGKGPNAPTKEIDKAKLLWEKLGCPPA